MNLTDQQLAQIWQKARYINDASERTGFRQDQCGAWIRWSDYGSRNSVYGWEVDHITPVANGGSDVISNLRPLHWQNNAAKQDGRLVCAVISRGVQNVAA